LVLLADRVPGKDRKKWNLDADEKMKAPVVREALPGLFDDTLAGGTGE
jgi:hypothetical protein